MIPANISVQIDEQAIRDYIQKELDKQILHNLLLIDINKLAEITSMSPRYLEDELLCDPRIRIHERRKNRKRWWIYKPTIEAIIEILDEW
ncbi:hypothetical protein GN156_04100 [bacterium LRH843]|nr:hypothetical protein [bacterium LRH843]